MPDELDFANERRIIPSLKKAGQKKAVTIVTTYYYKAFQFKNIYCGSGSVDISSSEFHRDGCHISLVVSRKFTYMS